MERKSTWGTLALGLIAVAANVWLTMPVHRWVPHGRVIGGAIAFGLNPLAFAAAGWLVGTSRRWGFALGHVVLSAEFWFGTVIWSWVMYGRAAVGGYMVAAFEWPMLLYVAGGQCVFAIALVLGNRRRKAEIGIRGTG